MRYLIGIDGGGTGCRAAVADMQGVVLGRGCAGSANIMSNPEGARENIVAAALEACREAGLPESALGQARAHLGLAGAGIGDYGERVRRALPFGESAITTDAVIALQGALGPHDGVVAIIGTGSVFVARSGGRVRMVGGWGFMVGDLGSGARIGRALLQETLLAHDGVHPGSPLTADVLKRFEGDPRSIVEYAHMAKPGAFGTFAPLVFDYASKDDPIARSLVNGALRSVEEALDAIMPPGCDRLCLIGGLAPRYRDGLSERYRRLIREPLGDALDGALALALADSAPAKGRGDG